MDRFAEKYSNLTPYGYAGNNPVLFTDVQGDSIGVGQDIFERFTNDVRSKKAGILSARQTKIAKALASGRSDKVESLQKQYAEEDTSASSDMGVINQTLFELTVLKNSSQVYNLYENSRDVPDYFAAIPF